MSYGTFGTSDPRHLSGNRGLDRLRALRAASTETPADDAVRCTACGAVLFLERDLLCGRCYAARRAPGQVLPFDPDRRRRTEQRLAGRLCSDCQTENWHVNFRGDAYCRTCEGARAATTSTGSDSVQAGGRR